MMVTVLHPPIPNEAPDAQGVPCLMMEKENTILGMSLHGFEAMPDDDDPGWGWGWSEANTNEAPWAWKARRPIIEQGSK